MKPRDPGAIAGAAPAAAGPMTATRPMISAVPWWKRTRAPWRSGRAPGSMSTVASANDRALERAGRDELLPARQIRDLQIGEIDGRALARNGLLFPAAVNLDAAHRDRPPVRSRTA